MKKIILVLIFLNIHFCCFSQLKFKRTTDTECKIEYAFDEFRKTENYQTISGFYFKDFGKSSDRIKLIYNMKKVSDSNSTRIYIFFESLLNECRTKNSYAHLIFEDDSDMKLLTSNKDIDCGTGFLPVKLDDESIELLITKKVKSIRLQFDDDYKDFKTNDKEKESFIRNLNCIINARNG